MYKIQIPQVSKKEILLAHANAKETKSRGKMIAKNFDYEFLLFISGKRDIREAKKWANSTEVTVEFDEDKIIKITGKVKKEAESKDLERISLSRI